ncbi:MAG: three-Cys-motif partner protein TcmP [Bacteroidales bacterium]|nr:three-Cys-motif partner protein TcmP [Bacteroidales bacterium]
MSTTDFFEKQTLSSKVKASIVSEYFPKYCKIIVKKHMPERIGYFDLFSGPGIYNDGNYSTPLLIAKHCNEEEMLRQKVWMVFNDNTYSQNLKENFLKIYPDGTFNIKPHFGKSTVGESEEINKFLLRNTMKNGKNECPTVLFIDPFGYKGIETDVLSKFLSYWGNELFIFINSKRINPALENDKFEQPMRALFPLSYDNAKIEIRGKRTVRERLQYIIDNLRNEYQKQLGGKIYYTAFKFQEEDIDTTSHFILHLTKNQRGFDLIKQIYNDFANVGTIFDGVNTYTFDVKKITNPVNELFDTNDANIDQLKDNLLIKYKGRKISAYNLFEEHQQQCLYSRAHYTKALRQLVGEEKINSEFTDNKNHNVSVLLIKECILNFK